MYQTTYVPKQTNHLLHLLLTFATCGMWAPVWFTMVIINAVAKDKHTTVTTGAQMPAQAPDAYRLPPPYPPALGPQGEPYLRPGGVAKFYDGPPQGR